MFEQILFGFNVEGDFPIDSRFRKATIADRNSIAPAARYEGLFTYVDEDETFYILQGGTTNDDWNPITANEIESVAQQTGLAADEYGITITLTDGTVFNTGNIRGTQGADGERGLRGLIQVTLFGNFSAVPTAPTAGNYILSTDTLGGIPTGWARANSRTTPAQGEETYTSSFEFLPQDGVDSYQSSFSGVARTGGTGPAGNDATIAIGSVANVPNNADGTAGSASVTNSGSPTTAIFDFNLPTGPEGRAFHDFIVEYQGADGVMDTTPEAGDSTILTPRTADPDGGNIENETPVTLAPGPAGEVPVVSLVSTDNSEGRSLQFTQTIGGVTSNLGSAIQVDDAQSLQSTDETGDTVTLNTFTNNSLTSVSTAGAIEVISDSSKQDSIDDFSNIVFTRENTTAGTFSIGDRQQVEIPDGPIGTRVIKNISGEARQGRRNADGTYEFANASGTFQSIAMATSGNDPDYELTLPGNYTSTNTGGYTKGTDFGYNADDGTIDIAGHTGIPLGSSDGDDVSITNSAAVPGQYVSGATNVDGAITLQRTSLPPQRGDESIQDLVGAMFTNNTETNITATYDDSDGTIDLVASGGGSDQIVHLTSSPQDIPAGGFVIAFNGELLRNQSGATITGVTQGTTLTTTGTTPPWRKVQPDSFIASIVESPSGTFTATDDDGTTISWTEGSSVGTDTGVVVIGSGVSAPTMVPAGAIVYVDENTQYYNISGVSQALSNTTPSTAFSTTNTWRRVGDGAYEGGRNLVATDAGTNTVTLTLTAAVAVANSLASIVIPNTSPVASSFEIGATSSITSPSSTITVRRITRAGGTFSGSTTIDVVLSNTAVTSIPAGDLEFTLPASTTVTGTLVTSRLVAGDGDGTDSPVIILDDDVVVNGNITADNFPGSSGTGSTHITDVNAATVTSTPTANATISPVNGSYTLLDSQHASTAAAIPLGSIFRLVTSAAGVTPLAFQVFRVVERLTNGLVALPNTAGADHGDVRILTTEDLEFVSRDHILTDSDIEVTGSAHFENLLTVGGNAFVEDDLDVDDIHLRGGLNFPDGTSQTTAAGGTANRVDFDNATATDVPTQFWSGTRAELDTLISTRTATSPQLIAHTTDETASTSSGTGTGLTTEQEATFTGFGRRTDEPDATATLANSVTFDDNFVNLSMNGFQDEDGNAITDNDVANTFAGGTVEVGTAGTAGNPRLNIVSANTGSLFCYTTTSSTATLSGATFPAGTTLTISAVTAHTFDDRIVVDQGIVSAAAVGGAHLVSRGSLAAGSLQGDGTRPVAASPNGVLVEGSEHPFGSAPTLLASATGATITTSSPTFAINSRGTWVPTPRLTGVTLSQNIGQWSRNGDVVTLNGRLQISSATNTNTTIFQFGGVPFAPSLVSNNTISLATGIARGFSSSFYSTVGGDPTVIVGIFGADPYVGFTAHSSTAIPYNQLGTDEIYFSVTYIAQ